jgi:uncharacterized membrane protein
MEIALAASPPLGLVGVSVIGAQAHVLAQVAVASAVVLRTGAVWSLAPLLGLLATAAGVATGLLAHTLGRALGDAEATSPGAEISPRPPEERR